MTRERCARATVKSDWTSVLENLPHWREDWAIYFVTWRLARGREKLDPRERDLVVGAIKGFEGEPYVVMDDHVHVLLTPVPGYELNGIVHSWKNGLKGGASADAPASSTGRDACPTNTGTGPSNNGGGNQKAPATAGQLHFVPVQSAEMLRKS